jgi:hypothetical protein
LGALVLVLDDLSFCPWGFGLLPLGLWSLDLDARGCESQRLNFSHFCFLPRGFIFCAFGFRDFVFGTFEAREKKSLAFQLAIIDHYIKS